MENAALSRALEKYTVVEKDYVEALREKGLKFAEPHAGDARIAELRARLAERGVTFRNAGASVVSGWHSKACVECTGDKGSETFSTTFKCHRDCYFCFNHNLADYDKFFREGCPWEKGLERSAYENAGKLACVGLTGGEPLLALEDSLRFLEAACEKFPGVHMRMYTSGDLLTEESAARLRDAGLREIRFSVKDFDPEDLQERVLEAMELATRFIPDVMVEMPIIPGTGERMKELFARFDAIGIKGINMLEFCFPFCNWDEFDKRGLLIRNPPFPIMYDYGYSGGLPIAGSEELILELMLHGLDAGVSFGMHYCSLENKHRSEMRQMNERGAGIHPCFSFDGGDFFLKTAKVFGPDRDLAGRALEACGCRDFMENEAEDSLSFPLRYASQLKGVGVTPVESFCVLERDERGSYLREVGLVPCEL